MRATTIVCLVECGSHALQFIQYLVYRSEHLKVRICQSEVPLWFVWMGRFFDCQFAFFYKKK